MRRISTLIIFTLVLFTSATLHSQLDEKLIAYWSFDDGTAKDFSGNGYHGKMMNHPTPCNGVKGLAMKFVGQSNNGTYGDHIVLPRIPFESFPQFTISMWVREYRMEYFHGEAYLWFGQFETGWLGVFNHFRQFEQADTLLKLTFASGAKLYNDTISTYFDYANRYRWTHYVMTYDNGELSAYIDAGFFEKKKLSLKISGSFGALARHDWSNSSSSSTRFTGEIDEVKIYSRLLTPDEIEKEYLQFDPCEGKTIVNLPEAIQKKNINIIGDANIDNNKVILTENKASQIGGVWLNQLLNTSKDFEFDFEISTSSPSNSNNYGGIGGNGFSIILQNTSNKEVPNLNSGCGFDNFKNAIAFEIDLNNDKANNDPNNQHVAVFASKSTLSSNHNSGNVIFSAPLREDLKNGTGNYIGKLRYLDAQKLLVLYLSKDKHFYHQPYTVNNIDLNGIIDTKSSKTAYLGIFAETSQANQKHTLEFLNLCSEKLNDPCINAIQPTILGNDVLCKGDTLKLEIASIYSKYLWSNGSTTNSTIVINGGEYTCEVIDENGCNGTCKKTIREIDSKPDISLETIEEPCGKKSILTIKNAFSSYEWIDASTGNKVGNTNIYSTNKSGKFFAVVKSAEGCIGKSEIIEVAGSVNTPNKLSILEWNGDTEIPIEPTYFYELGCRDITIKNLTNSDMVLSDINFLRNIEFSIPQAQLPITILAQKEVKLNVCYSPSDTAIQQDTLVLFEGCGNQLIPFKSNGVALDFTGNSKCETNVNFQLTKGKKKEIISVSPPYPNPVVSMVSVDIVFDGKDPNPIVATLFNRFAQEVKHRSMQNIDNLSGTSLQSGTIKFDITDLSDNIYYICIKREGFYKCFPVIVNK